jgi:hypothetical protein
MTRGTATGNDDQNDQAETARSARPLCPSQDSDGNVWYLGEDTTEYHDGKQKTTAGSFDAGVDGAQAGIAMPADPAIGLTYRQEYYEGEAEDEAEVLSLDEQVEVPLAASRTSS